MRRGEAFFQHHDPLPAATQQPGQDSAANASANYNKVRSHEFPQRAPNGRAFSGEPSEQSERPERMRGRRVRCKDEMDSSRDVSGIMVPASFGVLA
jgi:hypothetical protein